MILVEKKREQQRQVEMQVETSKIGQTRLHRQQEEQRLFYRSQIERTLEECEFSIANKMISLKLLR